ncbi:phosphodiesterase/alkaline phosphatase D-like protein [Saccharopolyspora lacisalsi]|uniref:Phosphodiesterase/alkaline phosphatase D-like protein n=1 Tax=Halosaccharopolyspora lacisalsi TaxID=1000566 RepID=A0A839DSW6_9PSEU|nr:alkaline phosphatase D family protein [Halosaccharopolyspora lacisalsi]MBA8823839.1 phosphodiesterase/alkaline phosphatase D-like protein [Halosaccharopolyspora lacisalsi]
MTGEQPVGRISRRNFLGGASATAVLLGTGALNSGQAHALPPELGDPFTLGVASGDPLPDSVVLWTRLAPDPVAADGRGGMPPETFGVRYEVAEDREFGRIVRRGAAEATPELGHSVHPEVDGLRPGREYFYRFRAGRAVSPVGRTRTAPARGARVDRLRFALASCQAWVGGRYAAYRTMAEDDLDFVVHVGDYIYEGGGTRTLADFRLLHARYKGSEDLRAAHAAFAFVTTFDDHEVDNNWTGDVPQDDTPSFLELRANAFQAYYEHLPLRIGARPDGADMRLYRRFTFGDLLELTVLDTRQYRTDQADGRFIAPRDTDALDGDRTMTGAKQERWLLDGLAGSRARWNAIGQQTIMAFYDYDTSESVSINHDQWDGYAAARDRLLGFVAERRPSNVVVLSGDWHSSWVNDLKADFTDPGSETLATEFVGTSISSGCGWRDSVAAALGANPHVKFFDGDFRGYTRCTVTPAKWRTDYRVVNDPSDPAGPAFTLASFAVADGVAGARRLDTGDGISGEVTDADGGATLASVAVEARTPNGTVAGRGSTDPDGRYRLLVTPGDYEVVATAGSYRTASRAVTVPADGVAQVDLTLQRLTGAAAGIGKRLASSLAQASTEDIVIENGMLAMVVAAVTEDGQLRGTTRGKVLDMAIRGRADQLDWINVGYASATEPAGTEAWQQTTVRYDDVRVERPGPGSAAVRASGSATDFPALRVSTTYRIEPEQPWIVAESTFTNTGSAPITSWIGDSMDHDGAGQRSGVPGHGTITTPYGSPRHYEPTEPWIGQTGTDPQTYGLIYDDGYPGLTAQATGNWVLSQLRVDIPPAGSTTFTRRIVAVDNAGAIDPFAVLSELYRASR